MTEVTPINEKAARAFSLRQEIFLRQYTPKIADELVEEFLKCIDYKVSFDELRVQFLIYCNGHLLACEQFLKKMDISDLAKIEFTEKFLSNLHEPVV